MLALLESALHTNGQTGFFSGASAKHNWPSDTVADDEFLVSGPKLHFYNLFIRFGANRLHFYKPFH